MDRKPTNTVQVPHEGRLYQAVSFFADTGFATIGMALGFRVFCEIPMAAPVAFGVFLLAVSFGLYLVHQLPARRAWLDEQARINAEWKARKS